MNKEDFLKTLEASLVNFSEQEKRDIIYDYEEHFRIGIESGKTEEELIEELGDPMTIANQYKTSGNWEKVIVNEKTEPNISDNPYMYKEKNISEKNVFTSIIAAIALIFFNLVFVLGPFLGLSGALIGLFAAAAGIILGGLGLTFGIMLSPIFSSYINIDTIISPSAAMFIGIGTTALGLLFLIGVCYLAKYFFKGTGKYVNWNISIIRK